MYSAKRSVESVIVFPSELTAFLVKIVTRVYANIIGIDIKAVARGLIKKIPIEIKMVENNARVRRIRI
ncbi:hypothetical protein N9A81_00735 [Synechococcus sp. AH-707-M23]|nr:hypothetical protein [Synechococcus sp. AH-707-M23]